MTLKVETAPTSSQNQEAIDLAKDRYRAGAPIAFGEILSVLDHKGITLHDKKELALLYDMEVKDVTQAVKGYIKNNELKTALGIVPKDEYDFVELQLDKWNAKMNYQGVFTLDTPITSEGKIVRDTDLLELNNQELAQVLLADPKTLSFKTALYELIFQNRKLGLAFTERQVELGLVRWMEKKKIDIRSLELSQLVYESPVLEELAEPEWDRFINALTAVNQEETKTVLKHFIWQVKRKLFDNPVKYHMMPVFFGPQEAGKSTVVRDHFCRPVKDFFAATDFATITDNRSHDIWDNYVLFFDEMGRSAVSHLEDIKRKITEDTFNARVLGKNTDTLVVNRATFIGTTNKDISRLIFDDTGMRRFYQVDCRTVIDWLVTDGINYRRLWQSVNENEETPLLKDPERLKRIKRVQSSKRQITMMERWLRERSHQPFVEEKILGKALFDEFVKFEQTNSGTGRSETNVTQFGRNIKDIAMNIPGLELIKKGTKLGVEYKITYSGNINADLEE